MELPDLRWVVITFVLSYGAALLAAGQLGDTIDHRLLVLVGALGSAGAMAACALAPAFHWFLAARVTQGLTTAMVMAGAPALASTAQDTAGAPALASTAPDTAGAPAGSGYGRGRALAMFTAATGFGAATGPAIGGPLVDLGGWPAVFWFRVPLALAVAGLAVVVGRGRDRASTAKPSAISASPPSDVGGAVLLAGALASGLLVIGAGRQLGVGSPLLWLAVVAAGGSIVAYRRRARSHPCPVLAPGLLTRGPVAGIAALAVLANGAMFVAWLLVPTLAIDHLGVGARTGGLALAAAPLALGLAAPLGGRWVDRSGPMVPLVAGLAIEAAGLAWLAAVPTEGPGVYLPGGRLLSLAAAMGILGLGLGLFGVAYLARLMSALPSWRQGTAGGLALLLRTVGIVVGVTTWAALFDLLEPGRGFPSAYRLTTMAGAAVAALAALLAAGMSAADRAA